jgi:hypothetical protein
VRTLALVLLAACPGAKQPPTSPGEVHANGHNASIMLTWLVYPAQPDPADPDGMPVAPLELVVGSERIKLKAQLGSLKPYYQAVCPDEEGARGYALETDEVAKITFTEGGAGGYVVKRTPRGLALIEWGQSDGTCPDEETGELAACPRTETEVQMLTTPANVQLSHRIVRVDAAGVQSPFECRLD